MFTFELAGPQDNAALRALLRNNPVPGRITLSYEREPDYFLGCATMGEHCQVLVARHTQDGALAGVVCRARRRMYVNGSPEQVGYLGQLRVEQRFRGRWVVSRGMRALRQLDQDGRVAGYLATITSENGAARGLLVERARRHAPCFREVAGIATLALQLRQPWRRLAAPPEAARATPADYPALLECFARNGPAKQFFPLYDARELSGGATLGFSCEDFVVVRRDGQVAGVAGLWDQTAYKQTVVRGYAGPLRWVRPLYNGLQRLGRAQPLPAPGRAIRAAYASFVCVDQNDPSIFELLLRRLYQLSAERGYAYLLVGMAEHDPLLLVARRYSHIRYNSRLYVAGWEHQMEFYERLDQRLPYIEIASL